MPEISQLVLPEPIRDQIVGHAEACLPLESCGLVAGRPGAIAVFYPVENDARSATTFRLAGEGHLRAEMSAEAAGLKILGVVHSHPATPAELSPTDRRDAERYDPDASYVHVVVSFAEVRPSIRAFRLVDGTVLELALLERADNLR